MNRFRWDGRTMALGVVATLGCLALALWRNAPDWLGALLLLLIATIAVAMAVRRGVVQQTPPALSPQVDPPKTQTSDPATAQMFSQILDGLPDAIVVVGYLRWPRTSNARRTANER